MIKINGKPQHIDLPCSISKLLTNLGYDRSKVAVERNMAIVPRKDFDKVQISDDDIIEIVSFVQGG